MAAEMLKLFEEANNLAGALARVKLAMISRISSVAAQTLPDTPENLQKLRQALEAIRKELKK